MNSDTAWINGTVITVGVALKNGGRQAQTAERKDG